jgi:hypothetical protein
MAKTIDRTKNLIPANEEANQHQQNTFKDTFFVQCVQRLYNRQKTALTESKQPLTQKHDFPHCSTNAKIIVRTNNQGLTISFAC